MENIIGQAKILDTLNKYSVKTLPKTILFLGDEGCGKHLIAKYVAEHFSLEYCEITSEVTSSDLVEYSQSPIDTLYVINLLDFQNKLQNQFLKFIEEPASSVYIILTASSELDVLPTILNRCLKLKFEPYTKDELFQMGIGVGIKNQKIFDIFKTPGKLLGITDKSFEEAYKLCDSIIKNMKKATYANSLYLTTNINTGDDFDKINIKIFFDLLEYLAFEDFINNPESKSFNIFKTAKEFKKYVNNSRISRESLMLAFTSKLWKETR